MHITIKMQNHLDQYVIHTILIYFILYIFLSDLTSIMESLYLNMYTSATVHFTARQLIIKSWHSGEQSYVENS